MIIRQCLSVVLVALFCIIFLVSCVSNQSNPSTANTRTSEPLSEQALISLIAKGDEALSNGAYSEAQVQYALAIKEEPSNIELLYKLAIVHYEKNSFDVARGLLRTVIDKDLVHIGAYEMLGLIALKEENIELAEQNLEKAIELDNSRWRSQNAMGIVKDMQSIHTQAQLHFRQALLSGHDKAQIENNLGYSHYLEGNYNQAEKHFRKATQINPKYEKAWANLGLVYVRSKQYENARYAFRRVVDDHVVSNNLGYLGMLQGDSDMARQELSRAILLAPTYYPKASENLASLDTNNGFTDSVALRGVSEPMVQGNNTTTPTKKLSKAINNKHEINGNSAATEVAKSNAINNADENLINGAEIIVREAAYTSSAKVQAMDVSIQSKREMPNNLAKQYLEVLGHNITDDKNSLYSSVLSFQANHQLEPTGVLDNKSLNLLTKQARKRVNSVLASLNYDVNISSENLDEDSVESLKLFQRNNSVAVSGKVDEHTLLVLTRYLSGGDVVHNAY